ncbi:MAG: hypothetical protein NHB15_20120 [Methanosarcina barkeri]|nr:hypothetical protein [Methanosarcina sp. ERenArc_MAG2]
MKYEDADILAFVSDRPKKDLVPQMNSGAEENAGLKDSPEEGNPENHIRDSAVNSLEGAYDLAAILIDTPEKLRASLPEALRKDYPENVSEIIPKTVSGTIFGSSDSVPETALLSFPEASLESHAFMHSEKKPSF